MEYGVDPEDLGNPETSGHRVEDLGNGECLNKARSQFTAGDLEGKVTGKQPDSLADTVGGSLHNAYRMSDPQHTE